MKHPGKLVPSAVAARARPSRRLAAAFGPRFLLFLLIGLVWLVPVWFDRRFLWGLLAWNVFVVGLWAWDLRRLPRPEQIEVRRVWKSAAALANESYIRLEVYNWGSEALLVSAIDHVPASLRREPPVVEMTAAPGRFGAATYPIVPGERGDIALGGVFLRYQSRLRIAERWAFADLAQTIRIYPNLEEAKRATLFLIRSRQTQIERRLKRLRGRGREFQSLREARDGDEWRDICWTASARRAKVISKVFQVERSQIVWLVLDAGRLLRSRVEHYSKLDYACTAALSLAQVANYSGDRVGLLAYGRKPQQLLGPGRGVAHLRSLVESLAQIRSEAAEADHLRAGETLLTVQKGRSLVVWLTDLAETAATPDVVETAGRITPPHLVLFAVMAQPELGVMAARRPENVAEMYRYVSGQQMIQRRDLLLRGLRHRGVLALEMDPTRLSFALVNHYLEIKERNLL